MIVRGMLKQIAREDVLLAFGYTFNERNKIKILLRSA